MQQLQPPSTSPATVSGTVQPRLRKSESCVASEHVCRSVCDDTVGSDELAVAPSFENPSIPAKEWTKSFFFSPRPPFRLFGDLIHALEGDEWAMRRGKLLSSLLFSAKMTARLATSGEAGEGIEGRASERCACFYLVRSGESSACSLHKVLTFHRAQVGFSPRFLSESVK